MQSDYRFILKNAGRAMLVAGCLTLGNWTAWAQQKSPPVSGPESPTARIIPPSGFGLGDVVQVEVEGTAPQLLPFTSDQTRLVLLFNGSPFRQMATNIIVAANATLSNSWVVQTNVTITTNISSMGTMIRHRASLATNATVQGHLGTVRLEFMLARNDANRSEWNQLLGSPDRFSKHVEVAVGIESNSTVVVLGADTNHTSQLVVLRNEPSCQPGTWWWKAAVLVGVASVAWIILRGLTKRQFAALFDGWVVASWIGVLWALYALLGGAACFVAFILIFLGGFFYLAKYTELIRDSGPKPPEGTLRTYSLARFQMAFWFFLSVCAFVFLWMITDSKDTINTTVLALMGIGAGTALGAEAQYQPKVDDMKKRVAELKDKQAKNTLTSDEECELKRLSILTLDVRCAEEEQKELQEKIAALKKEQDELNAQLAALPQDDEHTLERSGKKSDLNQLRTDLKNLQSRYDELEELLKAYPISKDFFTDILTDDVGISFHRFQMFVWTIVLGIIFLFSVYRQLAMPQFNETLLALMGISSGTYLGFMFAEKPTGTQTMTSAPK